jgi:hypothetical protein
MYTMPKPIAAPALKKSKLPMTRRVHPCYIFTMTTREKKKHRERDDSLRDGTVDKTIETGNGPVGDPGSVKRSKLAG